MGKQQGGKDKQGNKKFVHVHNHNPKARESDERRIEKLQDMEVKRHQNYVTKNLETMKRYETADQRNAKKEKIGWKGDEEIELPDLTDEYKGRFWEHPLGRTVLQSMLDLAIALHNHTRGRTKEAAKVLIEMLEMDPEDHLLDLARAEEARKLIDRFPRDGSCVFLYSLALIEHISLLLGEKGASVKLVDAALEKAYAVNPYGLWVLALNHVFGDAVEHAELIGPEGAHVASMVKEEGQQRSGNGTSSDKTAPSAPRPASSSSTNGGLKATLAAVATAAVARKAAAAVVTSTAIAPARAEDSIPVDLGRDLAPPGSVEDAVRFFDIDLELWQDTDGAIDTVRRFASQRGLEPPTAVYTPISKPAAGAASVRPTTTTIGSSTGTTSVSNNSKTKGGGSSKKGLREEDVKWTLGDKRKSSSSSSSSLSAAEDRREGHKKQKKEEEDEGKEEEGFGDMFVGMYNTAIDMAIDMEELPLPLVSTEAEAESFLEYSDAEDGNQGGEEDDSVDGSGKDDDDDSSDDSDDDVDISDDDGGDDDE